MQFSWTFSWRFFRIGVSLGRRSLIGGVMRFIPITLTTLLSAPRMLPSTSGYSSPRYSYRTTPRCPSSFSSSHCCTRQQSLAQLHMLIMKTPNLCSTGNAIAWNKIMLISHNACWACTWAVLSRLSRNNSLLALLIPKYDICAIRGGLIYHTNDEKRVFMPCRAIWPASKMNDPRKMWAKEDVPSWLWQSLQWDLLLADES